MNVISLISLLLLSTISLTKAQENDSSDTGRNNYFALVARIFKELEKDCANELLALLSPEQRSKYEKDKEYPWITEYMGKGINDIGDESECLYSMKENTTFFMMYFRDLALGKLFETDKYLKNFLEIKNFTLGLCIMSPCSDSLVKMMKLVAKFINFINSNETLNDNLVHFIKSNKHEKREDNVFFENDLESVGGTKFIVFFTLSLLILKILGTLIRIIMIPKGYDKYVAEKIIKFKKLDTNEKTNSENNEENNQLSSKAKFADNLDEDFTSKSYNPLFDFSEYLPKLVRLLRAFDLINDYKYLSSKRNRYFNDSGMDVLTFNRALVIFALIFSNTFSTLISLPSEEIINSSFFSSWMNIFYRLSNNALTCWIFLEGAYTTYKLLCFISTEMFIYYKKEDKHVINMKLKLLIIYGKFMILLIPKFLEFILVYRIIYFRIENYRFIIKSPATYKYIIDNVFKEKITCDSFGSFFNAGFSKDIEDYNQCYEFVYFYMNMILCIFIFLIISYLFFIVKNKIFELIVIGLNLLFFCFSILLINDDKTKEDEKFLHYHIIGQTYTSKIFISFIGFFHLGFIFGFLIFHSQSLKLRINKLIYEYSKGLNLSNNNNKRSDNRNGSDSISFSIPDSLATFTYSSSSLRSESIYNANLINNSDSSDYYKKFTLPYYPLKYTKDILAYIFKLKYSTKIMLVIAGSVLLILIDFILLLFVMTNDSFEIYLDGGKIFMFLYEKHFVIIIYFLINTILLTLPKKSAIRTFMGARIFIATSRIGFFITCAIQSLTYFFLLIFSIKVKLYVPTFAVISFGNFLLFFIVGSLFIFYLEFPLRIAIKKLLRMKKDNERRKENITK